MCGAIRYRVLGEPMRVTVCHCTFCQKLTGSAFLVEPIFRKNDVTLSGISPQRYDHRSDTSHKRVTAISADIVGRRYTSISRDFPTFWGSAAGPLTTQTGLIAAPESAVTSSLVPLKRESFLPANIDTFSEHALQLDGTPNRPIVFTRALMVSRKE